MDRVFQIRHHGTTYTVSYARWMTPPAWALFRETHLLLVIPPWQYETANRVIQECTNWLRGNRFQVHIFDERFQFYRMSRDFFSVIKAPIPEPSEWFVFDETHFLSTIPVEQAPLPDMAIALFTDWLRDNPARCSGGPWDGRRIPFQGDQFRPPTVSSPAAPDSAKPQPPAEPGVYLRTATGYDWHIQSSGAIPN